MANPDNTQAIHKRIKKKMARYNITIPDSIAKRLDEDADNQKMARSTLIAQFIEQHYEGKSEADIDAEISRLRKESADIVQKVRDEHEKKIQHLIATRETELEQIRTNYEKQIEQINADKAAATQQLEEDVEQLETISHKYKNDLTLCEERNASSVEKLRQSEASKNTVVTGLQHENEPCSRSLQLRKRCFRRKKVLTLTCVVIKNRFKSNSNS